jgi:predicted transcriptional regulator
MQHSPQRLQQVMHLLGDETRYKMFQVMLEGNDLCVTEISTLLGVSASAVSQHFRMFELAGLVSKTRNGQKMCYQPALNDPTVASVASLIKSSQPIGAL